MELLTSKAEWRARLQAERAAGLAVGLVPTMGALHAGHLSLMEAARDSNDLVTVTIFVNPTQFGDAGDLAAYPRDLDGDMDVCRDAGVSIVFAPSAAEMYPDGPTATEVSPGKIASLWEGASRPGHFAGVATIVARLFNLAGECRAYFGDKDYQQLAIVRQMAKDLEVPVEVVGCATVRETDGLAMSSRNSRLDPAGRAAAASLSRALKHGRDLIEGGATDPAAVELAISAELVSDPLVVPDYVAVVDPSTLDRPPSIVAPVRLLVAARVEPVRLIDNLVAEPGLGHA